jgi:small-conductance mechanosensitive channel
MQEYLDIILFSIGNQNFTVGQVIAGLLAFGIIILSYRMFVKQFYPRIFLNEQISAKAKKKLKSNLRIIVGILIAMVVLAIFKLDKQLYANEYFELTIMLLLKVILFLQIARVLDWVISNLFIHRYYTNRDKEEKIVPVTVRGDSESLAHRTLQYIFYTIVGLYILRSFHIDATLYEREFKDYTFYLKISNILIAWLIMLFANILVWILTQLVLYNIYRRKNIDLGSQFAINQLVKYIVYIFAFVFALDAFGLNMSILLTGAAALLVGIGLGLQQTFNDFVSGIVLLFERSVSVGDVVVFDNTVGTIKRIGLRASIVESRDNVSLIVPNHLLVNEKVLNWTHYSDKVRFFIGVGVAYGSDTALVTKLLLESVIEHSKVLDFPKPMVRFESFGDSSLDFSVYFYSMSFLTIEDVKSDIRLNIDRKFRAHGVSIPFPQRDVNIKQR